MLSLRPARSNPPARRGIAIALSNPLVAAVAAVLVTGTTLAACTFDWDGYDPRLGDGSELGGSGGMVGVSSSGGTAGSGGAGGSMGMGGGGPTNTCGTVDVLFETFDLPIDTAWMWDNFSDPAITQTQINGELVFQLSDTTTGGLYSMLETSRAYDLRDSALSIEVLAVPNKATEAQVSFSLFYDEPNEVGFHYVQGSVQYGFTKNGTWEMVGKFDFDPVTDRFWRMRETGGAFFWETSANGTNWNPRGQSSTAAGIPAAIGFVRLHAYVPSNAVSPGEARFDNLKGENAPLGNWCAASSLQDDFNDNMTSHVWGRSVTDGDCTHSETGGQLVVKPSTTIATRCGYMSSSAYDLTNSSITVEAATMVNTSVGASMRMSLIGPLGELLISQYQGNLLAIYKKQGGTFEMANVPYVPADHRWWRIREQAGTIYWETSPNGTSWNELGKNANPFATNAFDVYLSAGTSDVFANPGEAHFDNFNVGP